jgi:hypothetical protein
MGLFSIVFVVLLILKLANLITISWFYVFSPIILEIFTFLFFLIIIKIYNKKD